MAKSITQDPTLDAAVTVMENTMAINKLRAMVSLITGAATGFLRYEGLSGFLLYFLLSLLTSICLLIYTNFDPSLYFPKGDAGGAGGGAEWSTILTGGVLGNFPSFLLAWVLSYGLALFG